MLFEKIFEVTIIVNNSINFCINKKANTLIELESLYLHKCYMGVYIVKILDILQTSACKVISSNSSANCSIDVRFNAEVYMLNSWDILIGVCIEKDQSLIIGRYKKNNIEIAITFIPTQSNDLHTKQLVPVRIVKAAHQPKSDSIIAAGILLTCDTKIIVYKVRGFISENVKRDIKHIFNIIKKELALRMVLIREKKRSVLFFESLLYSYKNHFTDFNRIIIDENLDYQGFIDEEYVNLFSLLDKDLTGLWCRPLNLSKSAPCIKNLNSSNDPMIYSPDLMILDIAKNVLNYLVAIREFTEVYNTDELINTHSNIWNTMKIAQSSL